jgi:hypothetical protein
MPIQDAKAHLPGKTGLRADAVVVRVTTREELVKALRERTAQVIIIEDNKKLARPFELLLWAQEVRKWLGPVAVIVASCVAYNIAQSYPGDVAVKFGWDVRIGGWDLGRIDGDISFTQTKPPPPPSPSEE